MKTELSKRLIVSGAMLFVLGIAILLEHFGFHAIRWLGTLIAVSMIAELIYNFIKNKEQFLHHKIMFIGFVLWLVVVLCATFVISAKPWIMLLLLMTIVGADVGAWLFGKIIGGDKLWEKISANKTWAGQIGGIICGTFMAVLYGLLGTDIFRPELLWIGMSVSLLSQYGDLTASAIKRNLGIKDFGKILPGHGGVLDRFDGWIYVLPLIWFILA